MKSGSDKAHTNLLFDFAGKRVSSGDVVPVGTPLHDFGGDRETWKLPYSSAYRGDAEARRGSGPAEASKPCSVTSTSIPPRSIPTCRSNGCVKSTDVPIPGLWIARAAQKTDLLRSLLWSTIPLYGRMPRRCAFQSMRVRASWIDATRVAGQSPTMGLPFACGLSQSDDRMTIESIIDGLSRDEQIIAMELLWKRLSQGQDASKPPAWHRDVVAERVRRVREGNAPLVSWPEAKRRLNDRLK